MSPGTVIYPGSFDPFTNGHLNIISRAAGVFDAIVVAVGKNESKRTTLSMDERVSVIAEVLGDYENVEVESFEGLLVDHMRKRNITTMLRGMRTHSDFEYELQMATANRLMNDEVETLFMVTDSRFSHISSSLIKEIVSLGGPAGDLVPPAVEKKLAEKLLPRSRTTEVTGR